MTKAINALIIALLFMAGCGQQAGDVPAAGNAVSDQEDHTVKESHTLFTNQLELFVEFDPLVVGEVSAFIAHFTVLDDYYAPLGDAQVTLYLKPNGTPSRQFKSRPGIPGIYLFDVTPETTGEATITFEVKNEGLSDQFVLGNVHVFGQSAEVQGYDEQASSASIVYTKEQAWSTNFNVEPVIPQSFSNTVSASGEILAMPGEKQNVIAKNNGVVLFSKRNLVQGSPVNQGELLFTISGKGFTDNNISVKYHEARLQFEQSKSQYERHKSLVDEKIVSQSRFIESRSRYLADSVAYFSLQKTVTDGGLKVTAPLTGYIHDLNVSEGQYASTGMVLATISGNRVMLLRADVPQQHFKLLGQINDATFRPAYSDKVYTLEALNGKLLAKASSVAENNHYMPVYFEVINDGTLLEGAFAEFHLKTEARPGKLVIPVSALVEEQNNFYVYVQVSGESYRKQQVQPGDTDGIQVEIRSGLSAGDRVVTKGSLLVKAASVSSASINSHAH